MSISETSGVLLPPPLVYIVLLCVGYVVNSYYPLPFIASQYAIIIGASISVLSFVVFGFVLREFSKLNTSLDHRKDTTAIIKTGAFKYSRNPIYVSMTILCIGLSFIGNSLWGFVVTFLAILVITQFVILKEESYLEEKFGNEYIHYRNSVRRWL